MSEDELPLKKKLILETAEEICRYLDEKYCIDVESYEIATFINCNLRSFLFVEEGIEDAQDISN